jgi:exodeoxyribonuclease V gamma subunit
MRAMRPSTDFRLYHGNDLAVLAGVLAAELAKPSPAPSLLEPDTILIPQPAMKRWLQNTLAQAHGVAANLRFLTPGEFVREALVANLDDGDDAAFAQAAVLRWRLWSLLAADTREPLFAPLQALLARDDAPRAAWSLAAELAAAFEKYQAWRRDWLLHWDAGGDPRDWQAELWRRATRGRRHRAARLQDYLVRFGGDGSDTPRALPARLFVFACQNVSPDVLRVIASAARAAPLHFFFVSPVASWWGDLRTVRERLHDPDDATFAADEETPLLRANGAAGRDFVRLLFDYEIAHPSIDLPIYAPPDPISRRGLLHRLQRDLLARRAPPRGNAIAALPPFDADARADTSLQIHACATRLRELQVLHDGLRALLDADPTLQPRDIAVLAPDIDAYAPHVHAVFGAGARGAIPYAVADTAAASASPLIAAFLRVLALPLSRFDANEMLDLFALPAVAARIGLDPDQLPRLRDWIEAAGARWGLDAAHRVQLGAPADPAYTWAWALDRLLLGHATGDDADLAGVAPLPLLEGASLDALDALLQGLRTCARLQRELRQARDAAAWQTLLARAIDELFAPAPGDEAERRALQQLRLQVAAFAQEAAQAEVDTPIPPEVMREWFAAALGEPDARQPFLTGGVTFARMVPMRLIPFRVICVLGMGDDAFPRRDPVGGLNRIDALLSAKQRRRGDRSLRDDDRALFLQLFAAATDTFYVSWLGVDARSGEALPPSVVVAELLDVAAAAFRDPDAARAQLVVTHPLQPFAPQAFGVGDARRFSYRAPWRIEHAAEPTASAPFAPGPMPARDAAAPERIELAELQRALANPLRHFLRARLGVQLPGSEPRLPDAEPFGSDDALRLHALKQRSFALMQRDDEIVSSDALARRLLAEGAIAPAAAGRREAARVRAELLRAQRQWRLWAQGEAREAALEIALGDTTLEATLMPVHDAALLQFRAGAAHGKARLDLGLEWLAWSAAAPPGPVHRLILEQGPSTRMPLSPATARHALTQLIALAQRATHEALPLMPRSAWAYVEALAQGDDDDTAFGKARKTWSEKDGADPWVQLALRGNDPFAPDNVTGAARFRTLARELFDALQESGAPP